MYVAISISWRRTLAMPEVLEEVDRSMQADGLGDRRGSGLELGGHFGRGEAIHPHVGDHVAAAEERRHGVEQRLASPQHADARRTAHLVAAEGHEVGIPGLHVGDVVRHVLTSVDDGKRSGGVSGITQLANRIDGAEHVAHGREAECLGAIEQRRQVGEVELAVVGQRHPAQLDAALGRQDVPRHDVGVMLHLREHDHITIVQVGPAPAVRDEVQALGGVLGEDHVVGCAVR